MPKAKLKWGGKQSEGRDGKPREAEKAEGAKCLAERLQDSAHCSDAQGSCNYIITNLTFLPNSSLPPPLVDREDLHHVTKFVFKSSV